MSVPAGDPPKYEPGPYPPQGQPAYPPGQPGYAPPMASYAPAPGPQGPYPTQPGYPVAQTSVVIHQPVAIGPRDGSTLRYTQSPALIVCQHCQATVTTSMEYETGLLTWAVCAGLCIFGCFFGCCLIPFCIDGTKDVEHRCPNCQKVNGRFRHFS